MNFMFVPQSRPKESSEVERSNNKKTDFIRWKSIIVL